MLYCGYFFLGEGGGVYIGIMDKKMESTKWGLRRGQ